MRILLLSDLHVDFRPNRAKVEAIQQAWSRTEADVLVLAGDISHRLSQVEEVLARFAAFPGPRLFVAGNHDVWLTRGRSEGPRDSWEKLSALSEVARRHGFVPLEEENATVGGFTFVGSIGWYDYSFANGTLRVPASEYAKKQWRMLTYMDAEYARWGMPDADVVQRLAARIEHRLASAREPVVFVSHHVPLRELVLRRGRASWDFFNAYMGSERIERILRGHGITRFLFGHTHRPVELIEAGRCVINNPLGYPREALTPKREPYEIT